MVKEKQVSETILKQWQAQKQQPAFVENALRGMGLDDESIETNLRVYRKLLQAQRNFTGFICMGTGAFIGFVSCVLAILDPLPEWHNFFLFGLTSIAVVIVFIGLYLVFE